MSIQRVAADTAKTYSSDKEKSKVKNNSKENTNSTSNSSSSNKTDETAISYEPSKGSTDTSNSLYKRDDKVIEKLKAEAERRTSQLRELVEKMLLKQGKHLNKAEDIYAALRKGEVSVDEATAKQATDDISENGYWGVNQTSDRLVSFAKALTGGDPSKIEEMRSAILKGFESAKKAWGGELPSICQDTYDMTLKKLDEWSNSSKAE